MTLWAGSFVIPIGLVSVAVDRAGTVKRFHFGKMTAPDLVEDDSAIAAVRDQIEQYFVGDRRAFDLPLAPDGRFSVPSGMGC